MKEFKTLIVLDKFKGFFEAVGVDYSIMRKILQVKLTMDSRRVPTALGNSRKKADDQDEEDSNSFIKSLWLYMILGAIMIPIVMLGENYIFQMSLIFGILIFMLMSTLISDFSSVLLDIRDKNIIFTKPVDSKTLNVAKAIHVFIYMLFLTVALAGLALITSIIKHGILFFIIFLLEIILMNLFIVVITALIYILILKFFDGEKLKDIINYVQIGLSIVIAVEYQLVGRLFNIVHINVTFVPKWWQYFIVPIWFGAPFEVILKKNYNTNFIIFSALAVIIPIISIALYIKFIPVFERNLQKLNNNTSRGKKDSKRLINAISKIVCLTKEERSFFTFATNIVKNEREFKLKVYPSLGFSIIFPFIFIFNDLRSKGWSKIAASKMYLTIYLCAILIPTLITMMKFSGKYKAAWIYKVLPIKETASIFKGTLKAFIIKLLIPIFIVESIIFMGIFGLRIFDDLILVLLNMLLYVVLCFKFTKKALPFSQSYEVAQQGEEVLSTLGLMMLLGALWLIHYVCALNSYGVYMCILVMISIDAIAWRKAFVI
ncbi:hypothetical protein CLHOM_34450 [Clostridium homopropionicum DSM 5847]|uniref:Uncharacterized protein n=1 Tax=Clostridium homopropionicum DSM 5847 TaxID=1121318 RepID=A0A0L6Z6U2_9CLOT|nr:hypothetical protein [Clostridium homopropionicum]KOA18543.1 hypothetical protein CLHOM_34450 [Clostridium homopropionicum DSM 5847]SFF65093.1 hypothetical protein SAMN04488501_10134 [Clostridium homopropionicum]